VDQTGGGRETTMETTNVSIAPTGAMVRADDIFRAEAPPPAASIDLLTLDEHGIFLYARELEQQLAAEHRLRSVALAQLRDLREGVKRLQATNVRLIEEARRLRAFVMQLDTAA
jgi:hypothetical protein